MIKAISNIPNYNNFQTFKGKKIPTNFTSIYIPEEPHITSDMLEKLKSRSSFSEKLKDKLLQKIENLKDINLPDGNNIYAADGTIIHFLQDGNIVTVAPDTTFLEGFEKAQTLKEFKEFLPAEAILSTHKIGDFTDQADTLDVINELIHAAGGAIDTLG